MAEHNQPESDSEPAVTLRVDPGDVINALKTDELQPTNIMIMFHRGSGGISKGVPEDYTPNLRWNGEPPIMLSPQAFVSPGWRSPWELAQEARYEAKEEGENPDKWEKEALEIWKRETRVALKNKIEVMPDRPSKSKKVYEISYVAE